MIVGLVPGGPADLGGLVPGMVVTDVLDRRVRSLAEFREAVATAPADRDLILRIVNRGRAEFRVILREPRDYIRWLRREASYGNVGQVRGERAANARHGDG